MSPALAWPVRNCSSRGIAELPPASFHLIAAPLPHLILYPSHTSLATAQFGSSSHVARQVEIISKVLKGLNVGQTWEEYPANT